MDFIESPLNRESGIAVLSSSDRQIPCEKACTINNALFELLEGGLEVGSSIHVFFSGYDESAKARGQVV